MEGLVRLGLRLPPPLPRIGTSHEGLSKIGYEAAKNIPPPPRK